jgi:hypothetical protein
MELTLLAVSRFGVRSRDIADIIQKYPSSMTRWLNQGLRRERADTAFRERIDRLDRLISSAPRNNESMRRVAPQELQGWHPKNFAKGGTPRTSPVETTFPSIELKEVGW